MTYALPTGLVNGTGLMTGFARWAFNVTYGLFFVVMLIAASAVSFLITLRYSTERSFGYATFVGMAGALILVSLNLIAWKYAAAFILLGVIGLVWMIVGSRKYY